MCADECEKSDSDKDGEMKTVLTGSVWCLRTTSSGLAWPPLTASMIYHK